MKTLTTMAIVFAVLISLTACSDNQCDNLKTHNGEQQFCNDKQTQYGNKGVKMAVRYVNSGAVAQPEKSLFTMDSVLNALKKANEVRKTI